MTADATDLKVAVEQKECCGMTVTPSKEPLADRESSVQEKACSLDIGKIKHSIPGIFMNIYSLSGATAGQARSFLF